MIVVFLGLGSLVRRPTRLPLRSNTQSMLSVEPLTHYMVFAMRIRWIGTMSSKKTVKIP